MEYFSERNNNRTSQKKSYLITSDMYDALFDCCSRFLKTLAWKFPEQCPDGQWLCGIDKKALSNYLKFEIPSLYRNKSNNIDKLRVGPFKQHSDFDQYALLDFIEFIAQNCRDIQNIGTIHSYYGHQHINCLATNNVFDTFQSKVNNLFQRCGLLYYLTDKKNIERVIEYGPALQEIKNAIEGIKDRGLKELISSAISFFKSPKPDSHIIAVEQLWDAFERLKTCYGSKKDISAELLLTNMSNEEQQFKLLLSTEFSELTKIGNTYRIRHHEINKIGIFDDRHWDYLFNRCLSLIGLAICYLEE